MSKVRLRKVMIGAPRTRRGQNPTYNRVRIGKAAGLERTEHDRTDRGAEGEFGQLDFSDLVTLELADLHPTNGDSRPRDETDRPITPRDEIDTDDSD
ncbi:hypothetical protein SKAU_G00061000 [Synaphobranchus kaupii]|uniref:Uncharacterized protein n=1 Tax=Synaphobranchus kaupii TaxID=118154 RepID=A0A9Q1G509_SYNKA|nr:hypothetical protein SKAU_G00061000 [Synaphobranchus kaupii]